MPSPLCDFLMPPSRLERVGDAISAALRQPHSRLDLARAAIEALKYVDGADEDDLVTVSNLCRVEPVSLSEAIDAYLELTASA